MKFSSLEFPLTPDKGQPREESVSILESKEQRPIEYTKIAREFYDAMKRRDDLAVKETMKQVSLGKKIERRTLYLPETQFQNNLIGLLYSRFTRTGSPLESIIAKIKAEINTMLAQDKKLGDREREEKRIGLHKDLDKMMVGIESVLIVAKKHEERGMKADEYLLGTNDALDAMKKIDLVEYSKKGDRAEIRFIQVKTSSIDLKEMSTALSTHQTYLDSFSKTIEALVEQEDERSLDEFIDKNNFLKNEEITEAFKNKFEQIIIASTEGPASIQTTNDLLHFINEVLIEDGATISDEEFPLLMHALLEPETQVSIVEKIDTKLIPSGGMKEVVKRIEGLEEGLENILDRYFGKHNSVDIRNVDFYSVSENPDKIFLEKKLLNPLRIDQAEKLDNIAA